MARSVEYWDEQARFRWQTLLLAHVGPKKSGKPVSAYRLDQALTARLAQRSGRDHRRLIYAYLEAKSTPTSLYAWHLGEALRECGVTWCNGLIGLYAAGYFSELIQLLPHLEYTLPIPLAVRATFVFDQLFEYSRRFDHFPEDEATACLEPYIDAWLQLGHDLAESVENYDVLNRYLDKLDYSRVLHPHVEPAHFLVNPLYFFCGGNTDFFEAEYFFFMVCEDALSDMRDGITVREDFLHIQQHYKFADSDGPSM